ncbi:MAG: phosphate ABC transporter permease PstA [Syntrophobacteraceae bacterium]
MSQTAAVRVEREAVTLPDLQRNLLERRSLFNTALNALAWAMAIMACLPLFSVLVMLLIRGSQRLSWSLFTELPPTAFEMGGGFGNAILGTVVMVGIAMVLSVPLGVLGAVFLAELGADSKLAATARFCAKTLTGLPSILAGVFAYAAVVLLTGSYSAPAGGIALALLMVPTVILTAEEAMKMVPRIMKDAAHGIGCTPTQVITKVVIPTAMPGIITGVILAVARAAGETAPLLFTALFSEYWLFHGGHLDLMQPTASLAVLIYNFSGMPYENQIELAWTASLFLVFMVLILNLVSRAIGQRDTGVVTMVMVIRKMIKGKQEQGERT